MPLVCLWKLVWFMSLTENVFFIMKTVYDRLLTSVTPLDLLEADENMTAFFYQPDSSFLKFGLAK